MKIPFSNEPLGENRCLINVEDRWLLNIGFLIVRILMDKVVCVCVSLCVCMHVSVSVYMSVCAFKITIRRRWHGFMILLNNINHLQSETKAKSQIYKCYNTSNGIHL